MRTKRIHVSGERLREIFDYDPATGALIWKERLSNRIHLGDRAGTIGRDANAYERRSIKFEGERYLASRLVWLWVTGEDPDQLIDHINTDESDDRFENLRLASKSQNGYNRDKQANNKSGFKGVCFDKHRGRWLAQIQVQSRNIYLGYYGSPEAAATAYRDAAMKYHGEFARI